MEWYLIAIWIVWFFWTMGRLMKLYDIWEATGMRRDHQKKFLQDYHIDNAWRTGVYNTQLWMVFTVFWFCWNIWR